MRAETLPPSPPVAASPGVSEALDGAVDPALERSLLETVLEHARSDPDHLALQDDDHTLTYGALGDEVARAASALAEAGVGPGDRVVLALPNCAHFVVLSLACLWLGAPFVPVSVDDPAHRRRMILRDSGATCRITRDDTGRLSITQLAGEHDTGPDRPLASARPAPGPVGDADTDAYIIYTSGTTGEPKGVCVGERALRWAVVWSARAMGLGPATRALCVSPFHFDGSFGTAFSTLVAGGTLVIPRREELLYLRRFFRALRDDEITHTGFSPSFLRLVLSSPESTQLGRSRLQTLGLGGEECLATDLERLWQLKPSLRIFNRYGPTETAVEVTTFELAPDDLLGPQVPVGLPHPGTTFHLVDEHSRLVHGPDAPGELHVGGEQLMRGYWRAPAITGSVLRRDVVPGETLYRTGDLMMRDRRGRYVYLGRLDDIIKRRGVRISLREVTRAIQSADGVARASCEAVPDGHECRILAFVESAGTTSPTAILRAARARLPETMLPDEIRLVAALPLSSSGKLARQAPAPVRTPEDR